MKKKSFKIKRTALFVYRNSQNSMFPTIETDPTTNTITLTRTGIFGNI
jgi:hypothetical protein